MTQPTTTAALFAQNNSTTAELTDDDYITLTNIVKDIASTYSQNRLISVLEGGYNLEALARSVEAHVSTLAKK